MGVLEPLPSNVVGTPVQDGLGLIDIAARSTCGWTIAVGAESVGSDVPAPLVARTRRRTVEPTSSRTCLYVLEVAPGTGTQLPPEAVAQRSHWYENDVTPPAQLPLLPVSVSPSRASPVTWGAPTLRGTLGGPGLTPSVRPEDAASLSPPVAVAVTSRRSCLPSSSLVGV